MTTALQELETLPVPERVQLVEDLWDSIARSNAEVPIPQWQKDELARRKRNYLQNPDSGRTWDEVKSVFHCSQDPEKWYGRLPR